MKCTKITTFAANGKAITDTSNPAVTLEADEPRYFESNIINLYPEIKYQTIEGFGAAMTGTSAYLLAKMDPQTRKQALEAWFGEDGFNLRYVRMSLDSCDYSLTEYQAVEDPIADPELKTFSLKVDKQEIIPMLKEAMAISKQPISVLLSPWSPPKQWKTAPPRPNMEGLPSFFKMNDFDYDHPNRCRGGSLKPEYYSSWAKYVVKFIKAYLDEGVPVTMLTIQNEPLSATPWDSCVWTAEQEKTFLRDHLYPAMKAAGLTDKIDIFIWDFNKERLFERARDIIDDTTTDMIKGVAFHGYSGDHFEGIKMVNDMFPDKTIMLSEICGLHMPGRAEGNFFPGSLVQETPESVEFDDAVFYSHDMIGNINSGMNRWIDWNLIVDKDGGPRHLPRGFTACMIANDDGSFRKNVCFSYVGHFAKYILPGAKRIAFTRCDDKVDVTAVQNPDGSIVMIALNRSGADAGYVIRINGKIIRTHFQAKTISTLILE